MAFGNLDDGLLLDIEVAFGDVVDKRFHDMNALFHLLHAHHIAVVAVSVVVGNLFKVYLIVHAVAVVLANIVLPARCTTCSARTTIADSILTR